MSGTYWESAPEQRGLVLEESHLAPPVLVAIGIACAFPLLLPLGMELGERAWLAWEIALVLALLFEAIYLIALLRSSYRRVVIDAKGVEHAVVTLLFGTIPYRTSWDEIEEIECKHITGSETLGAIELTLRRRGGRETVIFRDPYRDELIQQIEKACAGRPLVRTAGRDSMF